MQATLYEPHKRQQAPNKQALSRPIPIPLYTWHQSWAVTRIPLHQASAPLHLKAKNNMLDSIIENTELI